MYTSIPVISHFICLYACLRVCSSACRLSVNLFCLFVCLSVRVCLFACPSICLPVYIYIYRGISLTSVASKVLERIVVEQVRNFLINNSLIGEEQHDYMPKRSVATNLL